VVIQTNTKCNFW